MVDVPRRLTSYIISPLSFWMLSLVISLLIMLLASAPLAYAANANNDTREKTVQLEQLRKRIGRLKGELNEVRGSRNEQQKALEKTDKAISVIAARLRQTHSLIKDSKKKLTTLEKEQRAEQRKLVSMRALLKKEVRASYMAGRQSRVKLLLNQEEPSAIGRMLVYQGYFTRARTDRMQQLDAVLARLHEVETALVGNQQELARLSDTQQEQSDQLASEQVQQRKVLARIDQQVGDKSVELKTLEQDEQRLSKLVASLRRALVDIPLGELDRPMKTLKGKLRWPVAGKLARRSGGAGPAKSRSRGVLIKTLADADIHAVAKGRVAFADWLRGFGLLLIIEHGDGYMSLYGHNNSLYKDVGEWVERGEVVAAAGNSGGQKQSGLYFEIRKDGRPLAARAWFKGKPVSLTARR